jgi:microcystin-dependent protein
MIERQALRLNDPETQAEIERIDRNTETLAEVTGMIEWFAGQPAMLPENYLPCDGRALPRLQYPRLWKLLGGTWGKGDGSTTFNLPKLIDGEVISAPAGGEVPGMFVASSVTSGANTDRVVLLPCIRVR